MQINLINNIDSFKARCAEGAYGSNSMKKIFSENKTVLTPETLVKELRNKKSYANLVTTYIKLSGDAAKIKNILLGYYSVLTNFINNGYNPEIEKIKKELPKGVHIWKIPIPIANTARKTINYCMGDYKPRLQNHVDNITCDLNDYIKPPYEKISSIVENFINSVDILGKVNSACEKSGGVESSSVIAYMCKEQSDKSKVAGNLKNEDISISSNIRNIKNAAIDTMNNRKKKTRRGIIISDALLIASIASAGALTVFTKPLDWLVQGADVLKDGLTNLIQEAGQNTIVDSLINSGNPEMIQQGIDMFMNNEHTTLKAFFDTHNIDLLGGGPVHNAAANALDISKHFIESSMDLTQAVIHGNYDAAASAFDNIPNWDPSSYAEHGQTKFAFIKEKLELLHSTIMPNGIDAIPNLTASDEFSNFLPVNTFEEFLSGKSIEV